MSSAVPPAPTPLTLPPEWQHGGLHGRVQDALRALPAYFRPELNIAGIVATDIVTLNTALGATIETLVVEGLNNLRTMWDPSREYDEFSFLRQAQKFPDVLFCRHGKDGRDILFGLELKGWYALAKEGEPSFRMLATEHVCAPPDLAVVFPWALSNVLSGVPRLFPPFIASAGYVARVRNHYWQYDRGPDKIPEIRLSSATGHYPQKSKRINDEAASDKGRNFGRIARTGIMEKFKADTFAEQLAGIPVRSWLDFFRAFVEERSAARISAAVSRVSSAIGQALAEGVIDDTNATKISSAFSDLGDSLIEHIGVARPVANTKRNRAGTPRPKSTS